MTGEYWSDYVHQTSITTRAVQQWFTKTITSTELPKEQGCINQISYNKQEEKQMSKAENEYIAKKNLLKVEQAERENELKMKYDADLITLRKEYGEKFADLETEKEDAENKEKADAHAKAVKAAYDSYIAQGFTKTQAESFIKICLEN